MMIDNELVEILQNVDIYNRLYEVIRLVDPVKKEVISYKLKLRSIKKPCNHCNINTRVA